MKTLRVDYKEIGGKNFTLLTCQYTNQIYYVDSGIKKLSSLYSDFKYLTESMFKVQMYVPMGLTDNVAMVKGVDYYY